MFTSNSKVGQRGFVSILVMVIIIAALSVGGYIYRDKLKHLVSPAPSGEPKSPVLVNPTVVSSDQLDISLESLKTEYKVGEPFMGVKVVVANNGSRFNALILITPQKEGVTKGGGRSSNRIYLENENQPTEGNSAKFSYSLRAFHLDNQSFSTPNSDTFDEPGNYNYIVDVFNCQDIENKLGKECGGDTGSVGKRIDQNDIKPLLSKTFNFNVIANGVGHPVSKSSMQQAEKTNEVVSPGTFPDKLSSCTKYKTMFIHPLTGKIMNREILGIISGKCNYIEQMPNNGKMECKFTESARIAMAQSYRDAATAESTGKSSSFSFATTGGGNPLGEALANGMCVILGYH